MNFFVKTIFVSLCNHGWSPILTWPLSSPLGFPQMSPQESLLWQSFLKLQSNSITSCDHSTCPFSALVSFYHLPTPNILYFFLICLYTVFSLSHYNKNSMKTEFCLFFSAFTLPSTVCSRSLKYMCSVSEWNVHMRRHSIITKAESAADRTKVLSFVPHAKEGK
jgi:hypothetical protein